MHGTRATTLGQHKGRPRIYLQGKYLAEAGFASGKRITMSCGKGLVILHLNTEGERKISGKKQGQIPVIDINSRELSAAFGKCRALVVRLRENSIVIEATRTARKQATRCRNGKEGALFAGGGLLSLAAKQAGYKSAWACELEETYADCFAENNPEAVILNQSIAELDLANLEPVELITAGIPCQPFSDKRRDKPKAVPEAHELGDMVFWALKVIDALNPATVLIEQVPKFLESGAGFVLVSALRRMGYQVESRVVDPANEGELCGRKRAVVMATSGNGVTWGEEKPTQQKLGDILEEADDDEWFDASSKPWLFEHWAKQKAKGNRFVSVQLDAETTRVPCLSKRYFAGQGDGAVVKHPSRPNTFRWLRVSEVAKIMGVPDDYRLPSAKTRAGEILGQAVHVGQFTRLLRSLQEKRN